MSASALVKPDTPGTIQAGASNADDSGFGL